MGRSFSILSPIDGKSHQKGRFLSFDEALEKLDKAEIAQKESRDLSVLERAALCRRFLDAFDGELENNARAVSQAMGKPLTEARAEIKTMRARTEALCLAAPLALADSLLPEVPGLNRFVRHEPLGTVMDIAAWNYPFVVAINVVVPAILAGNAVILKHAEQTCMVGAQFEAAFKKAGAPTGLVQDFMVDHETVGSILKTRRIAHLGFTGSTRGGAAVYQSVASAGFASCGLEMGGKDAAIVLKDAEVSQVAASLAEGAFYNAGQSCCAVERIYVPQELYSDFVEAFVNETHKLKLGDPLAAATSLGPVVSKEAATRIVEQCRQAVSAGAKQVSQDALFTIPTHSQCYLPPRVFTKVDHCMSLMRDESFGPVIGIMPYRNEAEATELANDSRYGLTASVWTQDRDRALRIGDKLEVGTVYMNRCDAVDPSLPWVGAKESGLGFTLSHLGIVALTRPKSFNMLG